MSRDLPPLNALRAFEAAARLASISRAGEELHVTHGAISRQIRALEEQLGVSLFAKDGRGVKLTASGERLREVASDAFARIASTCAQLSQQAQSRPFVLACPGSLLARWFIPRLDRLNQALPELNLQLSASETELDPRRPDVDATLLFAAPPWPSDLQVHMLSAESIGPVLSPRHPRYAELSQLTPAQLLSQPLLHTISRPQAWPQWASAQQLPVDNLPLGQGFEHLYYLLEAAAAGLGVAIAPQQLVADDLAGGRLAAPWGFVPTGGQLLLMARLNDPRSTRLAQWLKTEFERTEPADFERTGSHL